MRIKVILYDVICEFFIELEAALLFRATYIKYLWRKTRRVAVVVIF